MKAILFSIGTRGDIEPFLAIAEILKEKKWEVLCVFPEQFRETVESMNIEFKSFGKDFLALLEDEETKIFMGGQGSVFKRFSILIKMSKKGIKLAGDMISIQHRIQLEENADKIFYHPKCNYALIYGMLHPGKTIMVSPIPFMAHPIDHLTALGSDYGKFINRMSFAFTNLIKTIVLYKTWNKYKKDYPTMDVNLSTIKKSMLQTEKTFYAISPSLFPRPAYWPMPAQVVGYFERNKMLNWQPSSELTDFLKRYKKIVFITFGSMSNTHPLHKTESIVQMCKKHHIAAIINTSWGGLIKTNNAPDHILFVNNIPYDWIFAEMYAVVHHGGSGTTHTALKNGCPSLIIPHIVDQFYWGRTMAELNLGPQSLPIKKLEAKTLEPKLLDLLHNEQYKKNAMSMCEKMKLESSTEKLYTKIVE